MQTIDLNQLIAGLREQLKEREDRQEKLERALAAVGEEIEGLRAAVAALVPHRPSIVAAPPVVAPTAAKAVGRGRRSGVTQAIRDALYSASGPLLTVEIAETIEAAGPALPWHGPDLIRHVRQALYMLKQDGGVVSSPSDNRRELRWSLRRKGD